MKFPAALLALAFANCATVQTGDQMWYKEGATVAEQQAALAAAETQAKNASLQPAEERDIVLRSMTAQGWRLVPKDSAPPLKTRAPKKSPVPPRAGTAIP